MPYDLQKYFIYYLLIEISCEIPNYTHPKIFEHLKDHDEEMAIYFGQYFVFNKQNKEWFALVLKYNKIDEVFEEILNSNLQSLNYFYDIFQHSKLEIYSELILEHAFESFKDEKTYLSWLQKHIIILSVDLIEKKREISLKMKELFVECHQLKVINFFFEKIISSKYENIDELLKILTENYQKYPYHYFISNILEIEKSIKCDCSDCFQLKFFFKEGFPSHFGKGKTNLDHFKENLKNYPKCISMEGISDDSKFHILEINAPREGNSFKYCEWIRNFFRILKIKYSDDMNKIINHFKLIFKDVGSYLCFADILYANSYKKESFEICFELFNLENFNDCLFDEIYLHRFNLIENDSAFQLNSKYFEYLKMKMKRFPSFELFDKIKKFDSNSKIIDYCDYKFCHFISIPFLYRIK